MINKQKRTQRKTPRRLLPTGILLTAVMLFSNSPQVVATSNSGVWNQHGILQCFVEVEGIALVDRPDRYSWTISLDRIIVDSHSSETTQGIGEYPISLDWNRVRNKSWRTSGSLDLAVPLSEHMIEHKDGNTISSPVVSTTVVVGFWMAQKSRYQGESASAQTLLVRRLVNLRPQQPVATVTLTLAHTAQDEGAAPNWSITSVLSCIGITISSLFAGIIACGAWLNDRKGLEQEEHHSEQYDGDQQDQLWRDQQDLLRAHIATPPHITNRNVLQAGEESVVFESDLSVMSRHLSREPSSDDDDEPNGSYENTQPPRLYRCAHLRHFAPTVQAPMRPRVRFQDEVGFASVNSDKKLAANRFGSVSPRRVSALKISKNEEIQEFPGPVRYGQTKDATTSPVQLRGTEWRTGEMGFSLSPPIAANPSTQEPPSIPNVNRKQPSTLYRPLLQEKENCSTTRDNEVSQHTDRVEQSNRFRDITSLDPAKQLRREFRGMDPPSYDERLKNLQEENLRPAITPTAVFARRPRTTDTGPQTKLTERSRTLQEKNQVQPNRSQDRPSNGVLSEKEPMNDSDRLRSQAQLFAKAESRRSRTTDSASQVPEARLAHGSDTLQQSHLGHNVGDTIRRTKESRLNLCERNKVQDQLLELADADRLGVRVQLFPGAEGQQDRQATDPSPQALEAQLVDRSHTVEENQPDLGVANTILQMNECPLNFELVKGPNTSLNEPNRLGVRAQRPSSAEGERYRPSDTATEASGAQTADGSPTWRETQPGHDLGDATLPTKEAPLNSLERNISQDWPFKCAETNLHENEPANTCDRLDIQAQLTTRAAVLRPRMRDETTEGINAMVVMGEGLESKDIGQSPMMEEYDISNTTRKDGGYAEQAKSIASARRILQDKSLLQEKGTEDPNPPAVLRGNSTSDLRNIDYEQCDQTLFGASVESSFPTNNNLQGAAEKRGSIQKIELRSDKSSDDGNCKHKVKKDEVSFRSGHRELENETRTSRVDEVGMDDGDGRQGEHRELIESQNISEERERPRREVRDNTDDSIEGDRESFNKSGDESTLGLELGETTNGSPRNDGERKKLEGVLRKNNEKKVLPGDGDERKEDHENPDMPDERKPPGQEVHSDTNVLIGGGQEFVNNSGDGISLEQEVGETAKRSPEEVFGENNEKTVLLGDFQQSYDRLRVQGGDDENCAGGLSRGNTELANEPSTSQHDLDTGGKVASRIVASAPEAPLKPKNEITVASKQTSHLVETGPARLFDVSNAQESGSKTHRAGSDHSRGSESPSQNSYVSTLPPHSDCSPTPEAIAKRQRSIPTKSEKTSGDNTKLFREESKRNLRSSKLKQNQSAKKETVKLGFTPTDSGESKRQLRSSKLKQNQSSVENDTVKLEFTPTDAGEPKRKLRSSKLKQNQSAKKFGSSARASVGQSSTPSSDDDSVEFVKTVRLTDPIPEPAMSSSLKSAAEKLGKRQIWLYDVDDGTSSAANPITAKKRKKPPKRNQKSNAPERAAKKSRTLFAPKAPNL